MSLIASFIFGVLTLVAGDYVLGDHTVNPSHVILLGVFAALTAISLALDVVDDWRRAKYRERGEKP